MGGASSASATPASWPAPPRRWSTPSAASETSRRTHDRYGNRIDEIDLDPSWHWLSGRVFGTLPRGTEASAIVDRALAA